MIITTFAPIIGAPNAVSGAPVLISPPVIPSAIEVGTPVTVTPGTFTGANSRTYQWLRNGTPISGATGTSYTPVAADDDQLLSVTEMAINSQGNTVATSLNVRVGSTWLLRNGVWDFSGTWDLREGNRWEF